MAEYPAIKKHQQYVKSKEKWSNAWISLTVTWNEFLSEVHDSECDIGNFAKLGSDIRKKTTFSERHITSKLREEWCQIEKATQFLECKGDEERRNKVREYNMFLVKVAKNFGRDGRDFEYPWVFRKDTLARTGITHRHWENIWPAEGKWKKPQGKIRPFG
jgi:hypothetical protein